MLLAKILREFNSRISTHQLICLVILEIHIALSNHNIEWDVRILAQDYCVAIVSLVYPYFDLDFEQDEICKE